MQKPLALFNQLADRLLERLDYMKLDPKQVINCGYHTAYTEKCLSRSYPTALIHTTTDLAHFKHYSIDLIFSHLWSWSQSPKIFQEWHRVLRAEGLLMFMTVGPNTLQELRQSFSAVDKLAHVYRFEDMHNIGDQLLEARFKDPVMDSEMITIHYRQLTDLFSDLKLLGFSYYTDQSCQHLLGKNRWKQMLKHYESLRDPKGFYPVTLEIVYGHAWGSGNPGEVLIPIDQLFH